jgi:hypothetical protein
MGRDSLLPLKYSMQDRILCQVGELAYTATASPHILNNAI